MEVQAWQGREQAVVEVSGQEEASSGEGNRKEAGSGGGGREEAGAARRSKSVWISQECIRWGWLLLMGLSIQPRTAVS